MQKMGPMIFKKIIKLHDISGIRIDLNTSIKLLLCFKTYRQHATNRMAINYCKYILIKLKH